MPKNIFEKHLAESGIFKSEEYLYHEFVPERLPHRDSEIDRIAFDLRPLLKGGKPNNVFAFGSTGTGKTATVKYVLKALEEFSDRAKSLYLNCFQFNTRHSILAELCNFLGNPIPRRGTATDELYVQLSNAMKNSNFSPIIVLDEFDQLMKDDEASKLLYDLLRVIQSGKMPIGIALISNDFSLLSMLDARVKSSLMIDSIEFRQYTPMQLKEILRDRANYAFQENSFDPEIINVAAAHAAKNGGDARIAIESLLNAGRIAEKSGAKKISLQHLQQAFSSIQSRFIEKSMPAIDDDEKTILQILCGEENVSSGELFEKYLKKAENPLSERSFRSKVNRLASLMLVNAVQKEGVKGNTRIIGLAQPKEQILRGLNVQKPKQ